MASRSARNACFQCSAQKRACDRQLPTCSRCAQHNVRCGYSQPMPLQDLSTELCEAYERSRTRLQQGIMSWMLQVCCLDYMSKVVAVILMPFIFRSVHIPYLDNRTAHNQATALE
ncbi:hypothetical protein H9L39_12359 [Fusarium oxysporum f. sp. albedinis]|nr:hypothetical protein H9L39_12359 [Fusarium oxysporum f. sp. albedinis]